MNLVDDATGRTLARLGDEETIWAAADVLRRWIEAYCVPPARRKPRDGSSGITVPIRIAS